MAGGSADFDRARAIADAVLYEGYILYPYRKSSAKNRVSAIRDVVLAAAPELTEVDAVLEQPPPAPALIPVGTLLRRPVRS